MNKKILRAYHPWWEWECYKAGFYNTTAPNGMNADQAKEEYRIFLSNLNHFSFGMERVFKEWPKSCEQFLTHSTMNRIAWLGQAALCITTSIPSTFRGGFKLLSSEQQEAANELATLYLERWLTNYANSR